VPRFHINVFNNVDAYDEEGIDLVSLEMAKAEALAGARELVADHIREGRPIHKRHRIEITNAVGQPVDAVYFGDVIDVRN
jgi:hypothetical protein